MIQLSPMQPQMRQGGAQGVHSVPSNSIPQVNMHPQHPQAQAAPQLANSQVIAPPQMMRSFAGPHTQQQNQQPLVPQQPMPVAGHVPSNSQQAMQQHVIRNSQPFQPYIQPGNRVQMPAHRQQFAPNHHHRNNANVAPQMANMQQPGQQLFYMQYAPSTLYIPATHQLAMVRGIIDHYVNHNF